jgi:hypothetical protein
MKYDANKIKNEAKKVKIGNIVKIIDTDSIEDSSLTRYGIVIGGYRGGKAVMFNDGEVCELSHVIESALYSCDKNWFKRTKFARLDSNQLIHVNQIEDYWKRGSSEFMQFTLGKITH